MFTPQFGKSTTLAALMSDSETSSGTLASAVFTNFTDDYLIIDYDIPAKREVILCSVTGTGISSITRAQEGTSAVEHAIGAKVAYGFLPSHYADVTNNGVLGYAEITGDFSSTTEDSDVDVTGLSTTVTVPAGGRRVKITVYSTYIKSTSTSATTFTVSLKEGSTVLQTFSPIKTASSSDRRGVNLCYVGTPTAGSHTYKVAIKQNTAGTMSLGAGGTAPAFILVEYLGGI